MAKLNLHQVEEVLSQKEIKIFSPRNLSTIFGTSLRGARGFLSYNTKKGALVRLKRGFYALKRNLPSDFLIANTIYQPSYISLDTALSYYNIIPETVYSITSVTSKPTREFIILNKSFPYTKIKKEAFGGYLTKKIGRETVFIAEPEKALADLLYLVSLGKRLINERINTKHLELRKVEEYAKLFGKKSFLKYLHD